MKLETILAATGLIMMVSGCASTVRIPSRTMCMAHGGTFNADAKSCTYTAKTLTAQQACVAHNGYYDPAADVCEFNP